MHRSSRDVNPYDFANIVLNYLNHDQTSCFSSNKNFVQISGCLESQNNIMALTYGSGCYCSGKAEPLSLGTHGRQMRDLLFKVNVQSTGAKL